jgi:cytochrome c oxidase assembly protein subunit 15
LAGVVVAAVLLLVARAAWTRGAAVPAIALVGALTVQILLGIMTLLTGVALPIAAAHQGVAAILLACLVWCVHRTATAREMVTVT